MHNFLCKDDSEVEPTRLPVNLAFAVSATPRQLFSTTSHASKWHIVRNHPQIQEPGSNFRPTRPRLPPAPLSTACEEESRED